MIQLELLKQATDKCTQWTLTNDGTVEMDFEFQDAPYNINLKFKNGLLTAEFYTGGKHYKLEWPNIPQRVANLIVENAYIGIQPLGKTDEGEYELVALHPTEVNLNSHGDIEDLRRDETIAEGGLVVLRTPGTLSAFDIIMILDLVIHLQKKGVYIQMYIDGKKVLIFDPKEV